MIIFVCILNKKRHIQFFIFWLVALQLISPFLHAHVFGIGAVENTPGIHIHLDEIESAAKQDFQTATIHNEVLSEQSVGVLTGVNEKFEFESLIPFLFVLSALSLYLVYVRRFYAPSSAPVVKPHFKRTSPPRAPPSHY
ncbi:exported protein of unknown function [Candidatus Methylopumilus turicensis]|uniref:Uncharacterized protein n=1 Tax=Candidatus Methylopumilus turicensis TaxID=1581680 RepID=A0A0B7IYG7_9PROT|nr:exported protein of unknown function [Candidatus Methylopumilus turicensis]